MDMKIFRAGSRPSVKGSEEDFTGNVWIDMLFGPNEPARTSDALVKFEPGARTAWHHHPLGQYLIVTSVCGWTQCWDNPKKVTRAGDVVFCNCGKKGWHCATDTNGTSHIAVQEYFNGSPVTWLAKVSDEQSLSPVTPDE
jgi:quercetin dioxygenase-like cupin family protein